MPSNDSDGRESEDFAERKWLRDPYLLVISLLGWVLDILGVVHEWYDGLPRKIRVLSGLAFFLSSIYFGDALKALLDRFAGSTVTPVLGIVSGFPFSIQVVLLLLVILSLQSSLINYRTSRIDYRLITLESKVEQRMQTAEEPVTDGGQHHSRGGSDSDVRSSRAGALGGAATGAALGAAFGPGGVLGGAVLGAIVGDEVEKSSVRSQKEKELKAQIVRLLLSSHDSGSVSFSVEEITQQFPAGRRNRVRAVIDELAMDPEAPVEVADTGTVLLTTRTDARAYLDELDGRWPENW